MSLLVQWLGGSFISQSMPTEPRLPDVNSTNAMLAALKELASLSSMSDDAQRCVASIDVSWTLVLQQHAACSAEGFFFSSPGRASTRKRIDQELDNVRQQLYVLAVETANSDDHLLRSLVTAMRREFDAFW